MSSDGHCLFGCMSLKTGSNVIAILGITSTLSFLIAELITLLAIVSTTDEIPAFFYFYESIKIHTFSLTWAWNSLNVLVGILFLVNVLLLFGISKKKHAALLIWLIINLLILLVSHIIILANMYLTQRGIL